MTTRHIAAEHAQLADLTPQGSSGRASKRFRQRLAADGFTVDKGFRLKPGYLYTVVRAISARVNQNYDGWPSDELKKSYKTFIGKPVFVNHENHDPTKARGVVVAARYVENGMDKYIEVVQEVDAERFPKLAHEIKTGGLDSVSMGAEAGFTICSYCHNKATDLHDMCDHVINHKGKTLSRFDRRTGNKEDVLVFESCHKISFFELSYVFEPADETAVASKVVVAGKHTAEDLTVPAPPGTPTIPQSVIDATPVIELSPATELTGHEAPGVPKQGTFAADIAEITKMAIHRHAGECPPGMDCSRNMAVGLEQIGKDTPNNPVNQVSYDPASLGQPGSAGGAGGSADAEGILPGSRALYDSLMEEHPGAEIGGYRPPGDGYDEHANGALDFMTTDDAQAAKVREKAFASGAPYVLWKQQQWNADGSVSGMENRGDPTQNHFDHVHIAPLPATPPPAANTVQPKTTAPTTRAAGKYTKEDFANAGGKKPWETDTATTQRAPVPPEDVAAVKEIEAMIRTALDEDDLAANAKLTTALNTKQTYHNAHNLLNDRGAPDGPRLDVGSGKVGVILADEIGHDTYEPYPHEKFPPKYQTFDGEAGVPKGTYGRVTNLNVLNVLPQPARHDAIRQIGDALAPGGHALVTARKWKGDVERSAPHPRYLDRQPEEPNSVITGGTGGPRFQHGYAHHQELIDELQGVLGDGFAVTKAPVGPVGAHIVRLAQAIPSRRKVRSAALKKIARRNAVRLAYGEQEAPVMVDTLREEGSAPEDDNNDFERYVDPPKDLQTPDLSQAAQIDRQQEQDQAGADQSGVPGPAEGGPPPDQGNYITLKVPMPQQAPQVPAQAAPPVAAPPAMPPEADPAQAPPQQIAASVLDYFDGYYGRRVANWLDAIEDGRDMNPAEAADYRRQAARLSTLENGRELSTTNRNPTKGTANMARTNIASRNQVATAGRRQHFAEGPQTDGSPYGRNNQGEQEEAFISQTPAPEPVDAPTDDAENISNTEHNLVARVQQGRAQLLRDAQALASLQQRRAFDEAGGPTAEVVDPSVNTGPEGEKLTGTDFVSANPNDGVVPTNPKDASLRAFQAFDGWLNAKTGKSSRRHSEATIKKAAAAFSREAGISPQALFPALGIVLREARKNDKQAQTKGAKMRKRADEKLEVAAPDGRVDVEAPVSNTNPAKSQESQFDLRDFGNNAGDNVADPDLSTDQNWAPGEASKTSARVKTAGGLLAMRCAEGMIAAGLEPDSRERKYQLAAEYETMNRGLIQDRVALLERFAMVRQAERRKVASGMSRGAARSPIPAGLGGGTRTAAPMQRMAANDPSNDSSLFI